MASRSSASIALTCSADRSRGARRTSPSSALSHRMRACAPSSAARATKFEPSACVTKYPQTQTWRDSAGNSVSTKDVSAAAIASTGVVTRCAISTKVVSQSSADCANSQVSRGFSSTAELRSKNRLKQIREGQSRQDAANEPCCPPVATKLVETSHASLAQLNL